MAESNVRPAVLDAVGNRPAERAPIALHSENLAHLLAALLLARKELPEIPRTRTVKVKSEKGQYEFKYAPLDTIDKAITPVLAAHELLLTQTAVRYPAGDFLRTTLWHTSGEWIASEVEIQTPRGGGSAAYGGAVTYARRYGLSALLAIATETDNDAEHDRAGKPGKPKPGQAERDDGTGPKVTAVQLKQLRQAIQASGREEPRVVAHYADSYGIEKLEDLPQSAFDRVIAQLKQPPSRKPAQSNHRQED